MKRADMYLHSRNDQYDIMDFLADGTFGNVVKSKKRSSGELVAIKIHKENVSRREIMHEIEMLNTLRQVDPEECHIIHFYEYFHYDTKCLLVFEHLQKDLFEFQRENNFSPLPIMHIRTITTQLLKALCKLKELSIIHTDLKPQNIMVVNQTKYPFRVKLIDFGSAIFLSKTKDMKEPCIQTRYYRSPEILLGLSFCEMVDMWSLGCIMAELHLGDHLYPGQNEYEQIRYICETQRMPSNRLLNNGCKTYKFFKKNTDKLMVNRWKLKSKDEFYLENNAKPLEKGDYILKSLDDMELVNVPKHAKIDIEAVAEYNDLKAMVDLIKRMLAWDSHDRIDPNAAMSHPYISMHKMKVKYKNTEYVRLSTDSLKNALKQDKGLMADYQHGVKGRNLARLSSLPRNINPMNTWNTEEIEKNVPQVKNHLPKISLETSGTWYLPVYKKTIPIGKQRNEVSTTVINVEAYRSISPRCSKNKSGIGDVINPQPSVSFQAEDPVTDHLFTSHLSENDAPVCGNHSNNQQKKPFSSHHHGNALFVSSKRRQIYKRCREPSQDNDDFQSPPAKKRRVTYA